MDGMDLRSTPNDQPDPLSEIERACFVIYIEEELTGTALDLFSLAAHIRRGLQVVASLDQYCNSTDWREAIEYMLLRIQKTY